MIYKKPLAFFLTALTLACFSQERLMSTEKHIKKLKESSLQVSTGEMKAETDKYLKDALDKYWKFCPLEYVNYKKLDKDKPALVLGNYKIKSWTSYNFTKLSLTNSSWLYSDCHYDNLSANGECYGIDKTPEAVKFKTTIAVLNLNAQIKFHDSVYAQGKSKGLNFWNGFKGERLKNTIVLVPTEHLSNGVSKESFQGISKVEFESFQDINKRLAENKTAGYSVLVAYTSPAGRYFNIIDLTTGDYNYLYYFKDPFKDGMTGSPSKIDDKAVQKAIKKMYEDD